MKPEPAATGLSPRKLVIAMVGLPARGKSYIARKLARYLAWIGHPTKVFNVGSYRRALFGAGQPHGFFASDNQEGLAARTRVAQEALDDACDYLRAEGSVAIYDATNTTRVRRATIAERVRREGHDLIFIESISDDASLVDENILATKLGSPDYVNVDEEEALRDFRARIELYVRAYEPIDEDAYSFIKLVDVGKEARLHRIDGYLPGRIVFFLLNIHITPRVIWLSRHGQSLSNLRDRIGGDSALTTHGEQYARRLARFCEERAATLGPVSVWTSTLQRAIATARHAPFPTVTWKALDEIDAGVCDGMTYDEIQRTKPDEFAARAKDKLRYRYPRGESYVDVIERLDPVIIELERQRAPVMVVSHQAVLRCLYGYLMDRSPEVCPRLDVPLHTVIEVQPQVTGADERRTFLGPPVDRPVHDGD